MKSLTMSSFDTAAVRPSIALDLNTLDVPLSTSPILSLLVVPIAMTMNSTNSFPAITSAWSVDNSAFPPGAAVEALE
jgi:hypothetical protein